MQSRYESFDHKIMTNSTPIKIRSKATVALELSYEAPSSSNKRPSLNRSISTSEHDPEFDACSLTSSPEKPFRRRSKSRGDNDCTSGVDPFPRPSERVGRSRSHGEWPSGDESTISTRRSLTPTRSYDDEEPEPSIFSTPASRRGKCSRARPKVAQSPKLATFLSMRNKNDGPPLCPSSPGSFGSHLDYSTRSEPRGRWGGTRGGISITGSDDGDMGTSPAIISNPGSRRGKRGTRPRPRDVRSPKLGTFLSHQNCKDQLLSCPFSPGALDHRGSVGSIGSPPRSTLDMSVRSEGPGPVHCLDMSVRSEGPGPVHRSKRATERLRDSRKGLGAFFPSPGGVKNTKKSEKKEKGYIKSFLGPANGSHQTHSKQQKERKLPQKQLKPENEDFGDDDTTAVLTSSSRSQDTYQEDRAEESSERVNQRIGLHDLNLLSHGLRMIEKVYTDCS